MNFTCPKCGMDNAYMESATENMSYYTCPDCDYEWKKLNSDPDPDADADAIRELLTDSAKTRFDYESFQKAYPFDADQIVFQTIIELALNKPNLEIELKLFNLILLTGYVWKREDIAKFLEDKRELFRQEIFLAKLAASKLQNGEDSYSVYHSISSLLDKLNIFSE